MLIDYCMARVFARKVIDDMMASGTKITEVIRFFGCVNSMKGRMLWPASRSFETVASSSGCGTAGTLIFTSIAL